MPSRFQGERIQPDSASPPGDGSRLSAGPPPKKRGSGSNRCGAALQTAAYPLCHLAVKQARDPNEGSALLEESGNLRGYYLLSSSAWARTRNKRVTVAHVANYATLDCTEG